MKTLLTKYHFIAVTFLLLIGTISFFSCKKEDSNYYLEGVIKTGNTGESLAGVNVTLQKQVIQNGTYSVLFSEAAKTTTDNSGIYKLVWPRENFAALKLILEKDQYLPTEINLDVDNFSAGNTVTQNATIYPIATIQLHVQNTGSTGNTDNLSFTFINAHFDCFCCSNGWKYFPGANVDSTLECNLYGDSWLKYQRLIFDASTDTSIIDSIWCPAFQTTNISIQY